MGFFKRLFASPPQFAIYIDRSTKGNFSARIVRAFDPEIGRGKPSCLWIRPIQHRFSTASPAVMDAIRQLQLMGADKDNTPIYVERAEGGVQTKAPLGEWL